MKNLYIKYGIYMILTSMLFLFFSFVSMMMNMILFMEIYMFSINYIPVYFTMLFDWVSLMFITLIFFITGNVFVFSKYYMSAEVYDKRFIQLVLLFVLSMGLMVMCPNIISIMLGWDGLGLVSYCLVIYYQNSSSYKAGMLTILSNRIGDFGLIMAIIFLMVNSWNIFIVDKASTLCMMMIIFASITKSAQVPFSAWLPAAMSAPTPVSALVHSSTLVTAGVYLLIRFFPMFKDTKGLEILMILSLLTIIASGFCALIEQDMKKIVAMSTLSQLGFMIFSISIGNWEIAYFHMLTHAIFKSMLFLSVGSVLHSFSSNQDMRFMGWGSMINYSSGVGMLISSMCLMGIPFVSGFYSKEMIIKKLMIMNYSLFVQIIFIFGLLLTMGYSMRLIYLSILVMNNSFSMSNVGGDNMEMMSIMMLSMFSIFIGSNLEWFIFYNVGVNYIPNIVMYFILGFIFMMLMIHLIINMDFSSMKMMFFKKNNYMLFYMPLLMESSSTMIMSLSQPEINEFMWGEYFGALGISKFFVSLSVFMMTNMFSLLKMLILFLVVMVMIF